MSAAGALALSFDGKAVKMLKAGRYTITVTDHSKLAGLMIGESSMMVTTLSGVAAVGTSTHTVTLSAGKWFYEGTLHGARTSFTVTG